MPPRWQNEVAKRRAAGLPSKHLGLQGTHLLIRDVSGELYEWPCLFDFPRDAFASRFGIGGPRLVAGCRPDAPCAEFVRAGCLSRSGARPGSRERTCAGFARKRPIETSDD